MNLVNRENFFFLLFLFLPITIIIGSTASLINIIILTVFFLIFLIYEKNFEFLSNIAIKLLLILYLYLIFNSFISLNYEIGLARNLGFIRMILLFIFVNYFFFYYNNEKKLFNFWTLIILVFIIDVYFEYFSGTNLFGLGSQPDEINYNRADIREYGSIFTIFDKEYSLKITYGNRITSFFVDEPIAGAYLSGFIFLIFGHFIKRFNKNIIGIIFLLFAFTAVFLTGERSNTIKILIGIIILFLFLDFIKIKTKIIILFLFTSIFGIVLSQSDYLKVRYVGQLFKHFSSKENFDEFREKNIYFSLYRSGYSVFKNYPIFGVGNKNYRVETCKSKKEDQLKFNYICLTHPHQLYFEFLSEHGLVGSLIILSILFYLMFQILKSILLSRNYIQIGAFIFILINFIPVLPSGSFFSDFNITLFWINFSIMFACDRKTNIFTKNSV